MAISKLEIDFKQHLIFNLEIYVTVFNIVALS